MRIVIVGNGVAGMEAALALKQREPALDLTIVSEESDHFFSRPALMWVFAGQLSHRDIEPWERDVYARLDIRRVRARALGVDVEARTLRLSGDLAPLPYDALLIACGSRPRPPPWPGATLRGIGHFVTLQDLEWLEQEVYRAPGHERPPHADAHVARSVPDSPYYPREVRARATGKVSRSPAVVGGGLVGVEAVEVLRAKGLRPRFFVRETWFWPVALDARESRFVAQRMAEHGVDVHLGHDLTSFEGDSQGNLLRVHTHQGSYDVDLCVVAIGVVPNTAWLTGSGIELSPDGGILVNQRLKTRAPHVFAAGDCAAVMAVDGGTRTEQLWYTARDQGRVAARSMLGDTADYARGTPYNSAKLMDLEYTTVGLVQQNLPDEREWYFEEQGRVRSTTRVVTQGERVVGFNLLGRRWDHSVLTRFIDERRTLPWVLDRLHEASFDSEFVPPLRIPRAAKARAPEPTTTKV